MIAVTVMQRFFAAFALCCLFSLAGAADVPMLSGRVVDNAELLSAAARERIGAALKAHEAKTTNQIAVLTIATLGEDNIEQYAVRVFETWKLGKKDKDNGLLLVIVPKERKIRIEVGRGLEGTLPDVTASRMIRNVIAPSFKASQFDKGVEEGVAAIIKQLEGNASDNPDAKDGVKDTETTSGFKTPDMSLGERILFGVFIFGIIGLFTVIGIMTPGMGWFLYFFLIPFWALFPIVVVGFKGAMAILGVYLAGFPAAKLLLPRTQWYKNKTRTTLADRRQRGRGFGGVNHSRDSWSSSSGGWSSGGGGGSSGGGFSGGGGDSGGGGSS
ncbi:MAG: TPM domain-containing protein, partial [Burkholderiales bacterium]